MLDTILTDCKTIFLYNHGLDAQTIQSVMSLISIMVKIKIKRDYRILSEFKGYRYTPQLLCAFPLDENVSRDSPQNVLTRALEQTKLTNL